MRNRIIRYIENKRREKNTLWYVHVKAFSIDDVVKQLILEVVSFDLGEDVTDENIEDARDIAKFHGWTVEFEEIIQSVYGRRQREEAVQSG